MATVDRGQAFPLFAIAIDGIGTVCLLLGLMGQLAPTGVDFMPLLREPVVSAALVAVGAVLLALGLGLILVWIRSRPAVGKVQ